ncbi:protein kinase domain-containing protein [Alicyclobacillus shizuokensis]|uniref:protein kinase domain-containing protein n=1 Tax=Alicyclobacillus shizuokensis TaxID=392014 RepID=UPI00083169C1|nr:phosphotransferase [Alicyclobacillus shizuokensis]
MTLSPGTAVVGRWTQRRIAVERVLGEGANGRVYLVRTDGRGQAAMKVCPSSQDIALEWAVLEQMRGGAFPRGFFIDDAAGVPACFFYVMEWVPGQPLSRCASRLRGRDWDELVLQLLRGLAGLHQGGHAYCDVKPQNILIERGSSLTARFVDVGGVTPFGRSVRQFTPTYDRAFWGFGDRRADAQYDLFALALMIWFAWTGGPPAKVQASPLAARRRYLEKELAHMHRSAKGRVLAEAVRGGWASARAFANAWQTAWPGSVPHGARRYGAGSGMAAAGAGWHAVRPPGAGAGGAAPARAAHAGTAGAGTQTRPTARRMDWSERLMWGSITLAVAVTAAAWVSYHPWA